MSLLDRIREKRQQRQQAKEDNVLLNYPGFNQLLQDVNNETKLSHLPDGLVLETDLTHMPDGLTTEYLDLSGCTALTHLPEGLDVKIINSLNCTGLSILPDRITEESVNPENEPDSSEDISGPKM